MSLDPVGVADELLARRKARLSFGGYCEYRNRGTPFEKTYSAHHRLLADALDEVERGVCEKLMVMMPPGSAKSTYSSVYFPEYFLGRNPQLQIICGSNILELAESFGRKVRNSVASPEFGVIWPGVTLSDDNSAAHRWGLNKGGEYYAVGVGGTVAGRRGDVAIIDDPIKNREHADSERMRQRDWDWWNHDLVSRMKPHARLVLVMTRWHEDDLAGRLLDRERGEWKVIKLPMLAGKEDPLGRPEGQALWREWFTPDMVRQAQKDPRAWISLYQQEPRPADGAEFKRAWIQRYQSPPQRSNKILLVDPAGTVTNKSDFTSIWVVALGADENFYLVDGLRDRLNLTQRIDAVFRMHKRHRPYQTRYEQYGMQADIEAMQAEMERRQYRFSIKKVAGGIQKEARIRRLIPHFESGRIWLPVDMIRQTVDGEAVDVIKTFIDEEYVTFPVGRHDDALDNLARLFEPGLSMPWPDDGPLLGMSDASSDTYVMDPVVGY